MYSPNKWSQDELDFYLVLHYNAQILLLGGVCDSRMKNIQSYVGQLWKTKMIFGFPQVNILDSIANHQFSTL